MKKFIFIIIGLVQFFYAHSQEEFHLHSSFDNLKVNQKGRLVSDTVLGKDTSVFRKYRDKSVGKIRIYYETVNLDAAIATVEDAPERAGKKALHFKIISPNVQKEERNPKSRVQLEIAKKPGFKSLVSEVSVYLPASMEELNNYPHTISWLTLQEFWNSGPKVTGKAFRIKIGMWKSEDGRLYFGYRSQDYLDGKFIDVAKADNDSFEVPIGRWFKLRTEIIEGDMDSGFFSLTIEDDNKETILYQFNTQTMATAFCEKKFPQQGFTSLQPLKLYTSAKLTEWMKARGCAIEAYFTDWTFDGEVYSL